MAETRYQYTVAVYDSDELNGVVLGLGLAGFLGIACSNIAVEALFLAALSAADKTTLDNAVAGYIHDVNYAVTRLRNQAQALVSDINPGNKFQRAVLLAVLDQLNVLRQWDVNFQSAVAASSTLADLKTRVAALPSLVDITINQARNNVIGKISNGAADG